MLTPGRSQAVPDSITWRSPKYSLNPVPQDPDTHPCGLTAFTPPRESKTPAPTPTGLDDWVIALAGVVALKTSMTRSTCRAHAAPMLAFV